MMRVVVASLLLIGCKDTTVNQKGRTVTVTYRYTLGGGLWPASVEYDRTVEQKGPK